MKISVDYMKTYMRALRWQIKDDFRTLFHWDPMGNRLQCALRDGVYMIIDFPKFLSFANSNYGALRRFIRQSQRNKGRINPEDFKDVDTNVLREGLIRHGQWKGPLQKVDIRIFFWMYGFMFVYVFWQGFAIMDMMDARVDKMGSTLDQRRNLFDDDYIEEVRIR